MLKKLAKRLKERSRKGVPDNNEKTWECELS